MAAKGDEALLGHVKILNPDRRDKAKNSRPATPAIRWRPPELGMSGPVLATGLDTKPTS